MSPERPPRVQRFEVTSVPEPPEALVSIAERVAALLDRPGPSWPEDLHLDDAIDRASLDRELRAAEALFGPVTLDPVQGGDGVKEASWRLRGDRGDLTLTLEIEPEDGTIRAVKLVPVTLESPIHVA